MVFGEHTIDQLGTLTAELQCRKVLVVSDPGIVEAGHVDRGLTSLHQSNIETLVFDGARENPTTEHVDAGLEVATSFQPDLLIGLGGGSSMDCAKGINFLYSCGGCIQDYWGVGKATNEMLPMIAVPTTAGTGSEMQSFALISDAETHVKMACGDKKASCKVAILDPCLTLTQPSQVTALTGVDALSHALETFVTTKRNPVSSVFSRESFRLIATHFKSVFDDPGDLTSRSGMQLGAAYAGMAIENSMLGASHALANPLTATYGIAHGQAVGLMLPHVIRFNGIDTNNQYGELLAFAGIETPDSDSASERLADFVTDLVETAGLKTDLQSLQVQAEQLPALAEAAAQQWTGNFNPRPVNPENLLSIYQSAFEPA
ncbi:MAG: iron-containing alcohol dehydrogenase [Planctomycetota bacterium]